MVIAAVIIALQTVTSITELSIFTYEHQCVTLLGFWQPAFYSSFVMWKNYIFYQQQQRSISSKNIVRIPKFTLLLKSTFVKTLIVESWVELSYTSDKQIQLNYTSTDYVKCDNAFYQISQNGRLMAKGYRKGLLDTSSILDFVNTNILDVVQVFCMKNPDQSYGVPSHIFGYVTKTGEVKREGQLILNQLTFEDIPSMPKNIQKIVVAEDIIFALTNDGLYAMGQCWAYLCGDKDDKELTSFTIVQITPVLPKDIKSIYFNMFIFIHTNNGDVFAGGDNQMEMLPADSYPDVSVIRKVGTGVRRFQFAQNYSSGEYCSYYISGTDLIMFNHKSKPTNTVIEQGVYDFYIDSALVIIKEQSVKFLVEEPMELQFTKLYCKMNPKDTQCSLILSEIFDPLSGYF
ncbi:Regulator_of chromosome condensation 1/beta-lactamase-inhibitor protein II [Hexamita inflata]|uniref:Regulator of chromosome condensation 1/beta-lactamase-inhibitor protein II n=1 Tax=Hexamita inflata TaxID=28002 RepID=A0AA86PR32_9EUKA|nr:Regulator of chromosome condensation 1/beta-lactamase-inhibitor protein II [Hexamita inflata]